MADHAAASAAPSPPIEFSVRGREGVAMFHGPPEVSTDEDYNFSKDARIMQYSPDGNILALVTNDAVYIYDTNTKQQTLKIEHPNIIALAFSPLSTYILTWERFQKGVIGLITEGRRTADASSSSSASPSPSPVPSSSDDAEEAEKADGQEEEKAEAKSEGSGSPHKNLIVWDAKTGEIIESFSQKNFSRENWPSVKWTEDETVVARIVSTGIHFFTGRRLTSPLRTMKLAGVTQIEWGPTGASGNFKLTAFVPEKKGVPAAVRIYTYPNVGTVVAQKSFYRAQSVEIKWNCKGTACLVQTHTDVDKTGKSYYGETGLYYLNTAGDSELVSDGEPIYEAEWSPKGDKFFVVYGAMPAKSSIFTDQCKKFADFPQAHRNTARFSPHGHIIAFAGFGNLQGHVDFWDVKRARKIGSMQAPCSAQYQWSPCSNYMLTAVLSPRLRVDNGFKIWKPDGTLLYQKDYAELYQAEWVPRKASLFPDRPPKRSDLLPAGDKPGAPAGAAGGAASSSSGAAAPAPAKPGVYRPPHYTGRAIGLRTEEKKLEVAQKYNPHQAQKPAQSLPPGSLPQSKAAGKKKGKKGGPSGPPGSAPAAAPAAAAAASPAAAVPGASPAAAAPPAAAASPAAAAAAAGPSASAAEEAGKKIKVINKKLRQIEQLVASGKPLNEEQKAKVASEKELRAELAKLQLVK